MSKVEKNAIEQDTIRDPEVIPGRKTILVVDDNEAIRKLTVIMLGKKGSYDTLEAKDGIEAVEIFGEKHEEVHLVILDMVMPKLGGTDTLDQLRIIKPGIPVIISTGFAHKHDLDRVERAGINGFLNKPFAMADLLQTVDSVFNPAEAT